jgi:hypothetical protein
LLLSSSNLPLGVPNGLVINHASSFFSGAIAGEEWKTSARGVFRTHILYFVLSFALLYFYLQRFISKIQKK